jgi:hypothetical protein
MLCQPPLPLLRRLLLCCTHFSMLHASGWLPACRHIWLALEALSNALSDATRAPGRLWHRRMQLQLCILLLAAGCNGRTAHHVSQVCWQLLGWQVPCAAAAAAVLLRTRWTGVCPARQRGRSCKRRSCMLVVVASSGRRFSAVMCLTIPSG